MQYRTLGRTGIKVTPYALGAMMFGGIGNAEHDDSIRIIHKALDAGINVVDTADRYSAGECMRMAAIGAEAQVAWAHGSREPDRYRLLAKR